MIACDTVDGGTFWLEGYLTEETCWGLIMNPGELLREAVVDRTFLVDAPTRRGFLQLCEEWNNRDKDREDQAWREIIQGLKWLLEYPDPDEGEVDHG